MKKIIYLIFILLFAMNFMSCKKHIKLTFSDYEIVKQNNDYTLIEMKIRNEKILNRLKSEKDISLTFKLNNRLYVAKGNEIVKSSVPVDCDYFFPTDDAGNVVFFDDKLFLYKIYGR
ncbi:MAG: hypothetical protein J5798_05105 [Spirochaetaceae bacterium]|nr:hypothetical protein [Spirochaetaceae bacterium]